MKRLVLCLVLILLLTTVTTGFKALAGQIGPGDFEGNETVQDFNGLGLPFDNVTPLIIGDDTYTTDDNNLRYANFGMPAPFSNESIGSNTDLGFIDVVLNTPVLRAGADTGVINAWSAQVEFFNEADDLLGTVNVAEDSGISAFAGWEADAGLIKRIRFIDTTTNGLILLVDNLTTEQGQPSQQVDLDIEAFPNPATVGGPLDILLDLENSGDGFDAEFRLYVLVVGDITTLLDISPFVPSGVLTGLNIFSTTSVPAGLPPAVGFLATIFNAASGELLDWDFEVVGIGAAPSAADINALRQAATEYLE